ncbi:serpin B [Caldicoprobacter guelmensis]|uniref:serpin family protein n=1 Tax=Caldicoprobacter guelmensis TaxID=1170224 RepID=UPI001FAED2AE|nr:serpin family protein [Caldicoprobacter guelmensis]MBM7582918.1 serpin B [Caldicoprobacter guelmensis]
MKGFAKFFMGILLITVMLIMTSCSSIGRYFGDSGLFEGASIGISKLPPPAKEVDNRVVQANTRFAFKLFNQLIEQQPGENVFISPASIGMALAMTYNGADGETKDAMAKVLEVQGIDIEDFNKAYAALKTILQNPDPGVQVVIANSLWARKGMSFYDDFLNINKKFYGAEVQELDFNSPNASKIINGWVKKQSKGKIDKIIGDTISPDTIMFLINVLYFKGGWTNKFDPALTREEPFSLDNGTQKVHPIMFQTGKKYPYYKGENFQAVSLPYGNGRVSMVVFLPDEGVDLSEFCRGITLEKWEEWMNSFSNTQGEVGLPKFKLEYEVELNEALKALGMEVAFDPERANFAKMHPIAPGANVYISGVKHKTFVETNEQGTEASGATSVEVGITSVPVDNFSMIVNRPFFFVIRDNETGSLLFMGAIVDPLYEK